MTVDPSWCKSCRSRYDREYYNKHTDRIKAYRREQYKKNPNHFKDIQNKWKVAHPEKVSEFQRNWYRKNCYGKSLHMPTQKVLQKHGLSLEEYGQLWIEQEGVCGICRCKYIPTKPKIRECLHIDHDHLTGKIRGLLCPSCNIGLGAFKDNPTYLKSAIQYLEEAP